MATKSWAAANSGGWSVAGRWSPSGIPASTDNVFIAVTGANYNVTLNTSATVSSLTISSANATMVSTIGTTVRALTVTGATTISGGTINQSLASQSISTGSLSVTSGSLIESAGAFTVTNNASFSNSSGSDTFSGSSKFTTGTLTVGSGTTLTLSGSTAVTAGAGGIVDLGLIKGSGTLAGKVSGSGIVDGSGGKLDVTGSVANTVTLQVGATAGSTLELDNTVAAGGAVTFNAGPAGVSILDLHNATALASFNGGGADITNFDFISTGIGPTIVQEIDAETVTFANVASATLTSAGATDTLTLFNAGSVALATFTLNGILPSGSPMVAWTKDSGTGTDIFLSNTVCFASGSRILTSAGEKAVEDMVAGDMVVTVVNGEHIAQPVIWVGERRIDIAAAPRPELVAPVRIRKDAFGDGMPRRDLVVSPDHCMFVDGKLIPAKLLLNGMTITQERDARPVHYYHIETEHHAVLLAEGLPTESYLDTGNRAYFTNSGLALVLHPEFHVNAGLKCWEEDACAPLAVSEEAVRPVWTTLASRAETLGYRQPDVVTTEDADMRLVANGRTIRPVSVRGERHMFVVPAGTSDVRLVSRIAIPSDGAPWVDDWRRLGVAVKRIVVRSDDGLLDIPADHPALADGWYKAERDAATTVAVDRWQRRLAAGIRRRRNHGGSACRHHRPVRHRAGRTPGCLIRLTGGCTTHGPVDDRAVCVCACSAGGRGGITPRRTRADRVCHRGFRAVAGQLADPCTPRRRISHADRRTGPADSGASGCGRLPRCVRAVQRDAGRSLAVPSGGLPRSGKARDRFHPLRPGRGLAG